MTARGRRTWTPTLLALGFVAAVVALAVLRVDGRPAPGPDPRPALTAAGCSFRTAPSQGREHVSALPVGFRYDTFPPTSGPHSPTPAEWSAHRQPIPQLELVHNLEHGGIVVQYGTEVPRATVERILAWYEGDPTGLVVAPLPALGREVALTAWTRLARCPTFRAGAFDAFRDAFRYQGPERVPLSSLRQGS
jgi:hypothetical protein